jgi:hypothetical protein
MATTNEPLGACEFLNGDFPDILSVLEHDVHYHLGIYLSLALQPFLDLGRFFNFLIFYTVGRTPWTGDQPVARYTTAQTQNKRTQTSMPQVGLKHTIPVSEQAKTVHASDRAATVIGTMYVYPVYFLVLITCC